MRAMIWLIAASMALVAAGCSRTNDTGNQDMAPADEPMTSPNTMPPEETPPDQSQPDMTTPDTTSPDTTTGGETTPPPENSPPPQ